MNTLSFNQWIQKESLPPRQFTPKDWFSCLVHYVRAVIDREQQPCGKRKLYYISAEFLLGRTLISNLCNLGLYDEVRDTLASYGVDLGELEELEIEPSLGNGGLGRLSACYSDSATSMGLSCTGLSLAYHHGLFRQVFRNNQQTEEPDPWRGEDDWTAAEDHKCTVTFRDCQFDSMAHSIPVTSPDKQVNRLVLFDTPHAYEENPQDGAQAYRAGKAQGVMRNLYPIDNYPEGRLQRIRQEYFMCSCSADYILNDCVRRGCQLYDLHEYAAIQINDTHPALVIPELIRLLTQRGLTFHQAVDTVVKTCAYTNHTILAEALEKWHYDEMQQIIPHLMPIICELHCIVERANREPSVQIIDDGGMIHMAAIAIHFSAHTNGVAKLHTSILQNTTLKAFHDMYPDRILNVTNGVTFRRWMYQCNPELTQLLTVLIGDGFRKDSTQLSELKDFADSEDVLKALEHIKFCKKQQFSDWLTAHQGDSFDPHSILDVQAKRIHAYKRQQLNCLWIIREIARIRAGHLPKRPITVVLAGKAAASYVAAHNVIHLALCLSELIRRDPQLSRYLKVIVVENYNVTAAEKLLPAADISEQISLASQEASGTGNMKMMLNGALTLGTMDGANIEIHQAVGDQNIYIFGERSENVIARHQTHSYHPRALYEADPELRQAVDFLIGDELTSVGDGSCLKQLHDELLYDDYFMTFLDFRSYVETKERMLADYEDRPAWLRKALINIAGAGVFSSDRAIQEYNDLIWHL